MNFRHLQFPIIALGAMLIYSTSHAKAHADYIFDFTGGVGSPHFADLDNLNSGSTSAGGGTLTATAIGPLGPSNEPIELNFHSSDGLGANVVNDGSDESNKLDANGGSAEAIQFVLNQSGTLDEVLIDGMGWGDQTDYEYVDLLIDGNYVATLLDTDADAATQAQHGNAIVGAASDEFYGLGIAYSAGQILTLQYGEAGANNGWRIESFSVSSVPEPSSAIVLLCLVAAVGSRRRRG